MGNTAFSWDGLFIVGGSDEGGSSTFTTTRFHDTNPFSGTGLEITVSETGEHLCTYKTRTPSPVVAWAPNKYAIAYIDSGTLKTIGASLGGK